MTDRPAIYSQAIRVHVVLPSSRGLAIEIGIMSARINVGFRLDAVWSGADIDLLIGAGAMER